jgi:hypothetical protein
MCKDFHVRMQALHVTLPDAPGRAAHTLLAFALPSLCLSPSFPFPQYLLHGQCLPSCETTPGFVASGTSRLGRRCVPDAGTLGGIGPLGDRAFRAIKEDPKAVSQQSFPL